MAEPTRTRIVHVALAVLIGLVLAATLRSVEADEPQPVPPVAEPEPVPLEELPANPPPTGEDTAGGFVTRLSNVVQPNGEPLSFDHQIDPGLWTADAPTVLTVPSSGWWRVGVNLTTLGERYGGPSNSDVAVSVVRNWNRSTPFLTSTVAMERFHNSDHGWNAEVNSLLQPVWLEQGDRLEVVTVGGPEGLLIESNPSDGLPNGFPTDEGSGTLSPHFFLLPL